MDTVTEEQYQEYLLQWCTDMFDQWEQMKAGFSKRFDLSSLEEWEDTCLKLKQKLQAEAVESDDFLTAKNLFEQWEVFLREAFPDQRDMEFEEEEPRDLKRETLRIIKPFVEYGLKEAAFTSYEHALTEVSAIAYLLGKGFDPEKAYKTVESWEVNESFNE